jgi:branched-chain amino acid transport system permease protein
MDQAVLKGAEPVIALADESAIAQALKTEARWRWAETAFWAVIAACYFAFPRQLPIMNEIAILALFALSLDLILGYGGIVSLGHAAFFGLGAYTAGLFALHISPDPLPGLAAAAIVPALLGFLTSLLLLRGSDLTRLMLTLAIALVLQEAANQLGAYTGGADGLQGIAMGSIAGRFAFDLSGQTAAAYSLITLFILFLIARRMMASPFGLSVRAIRDNPRRAAAIGVPVNRRLMAIYTVAGGYAGVAGGLLAQTTQFVSLDVFDFQRSADLILVLIIGGAGYLYGGLAGAIVFKLMQDGLAAITPQYWQFWVGLLLVIFVLAGRERISEALLALRRRLTGQLLEPRP